MVYLRCFGVCAVYPVSVGPGVHLGQGSSSNWISTERKRRKVKLRGKLHTRRPRRLAAACISTQLSHGPLTVSSATLGSVVPGPTSTRHPSPPLPLFHSTPLVSLLPASPKIRVHGPNLASGSFSNTPTSPSMLFSTLTFSRLFFCSCRMTCCDFTRTWALFVINRAIYVGDVGVAIKVELRGRVVGLEGWVLGSFVLFFRLSLAFRFPLCF